MTTSVQTSNISLQLSGAAFISEQSINRAHTVMATINTLGQKLELANRRADQLLELQRKAMEIDAMRKDGVITLVKPSATNANQQVPDMDKLNAVLDFVKTHNDMYADSPSKQITAGGAWNDKNNDGAITADEVDVANLAKFDLKFDGISLMDKNTADSAKTAIGNAIAASTKLVEDDSMALQQAWANYQAAIQLASVMIQKNGNLLEFIFAHW